jgi:hypothetical protein
MTLPRFHLLAALLLMACGPGANEPVAEPEQRAGPPSTPAAQAISPVPTPAATNLVGEYRVAGIDGEELNAPTGIAVSITESTIDLAPCAGFAWTYTYENRVLETKRIPVSPTGIVCRIPEEAALAGEAMAEATRVRLTAANGLEFSGGGRSVLLFSQ